MSKINLPESLDKLFTPDFINAYANHHFIHYNTIFDFLSRLGIKNREDLENCSIEALNDFIRENTISRSWEDYVFSAKKSKRPL